MDHVLRRLREIAKERLKEQEERGEAKQALRDAISGIDRVLSQLPNPNYPRGDLNAEVVRVMIQLGEGGGFKE